MTEHTSSDTQTSTAPPEQGAAGTPSANEGFFDRLRRMDLRRSADGWLGGVCAGFAHRVGLDPLVVRAGAVLLVIFFGLGLLLYLLAWAVIPDSQGRTHVEEGLRGGAASSIFLLVITSLVFLGSLPWWAGSAFGFDGGFGLVGLVVTALLAWGVWSLWQRRPEPGSVVDPPGQAGPWPGAAAASSGTAPPPPPGSAATQTTAVPAAAAAPGATYGAGTPPPPPPGTAAGSAPPPPPAPPRPRRPRRRSGGVAATALAFGLLLVILAAALWAPQGPGLPGNDLSVALAACAAVLGLLLIALGVAGRRAGFVGFLTGVGVVAALLTAPLPANLQWEGRAGEATWAPRSTSDLQDYRLAAGDAELDLTRLDASALDGQDLDVSLGAGSLSILVPEDLTVEVDSSIGAGELRLRDTRESAEAAVPRFSDGRTNDTTSGLGIQETVELGEENQPQLVIDASVGVGEIVIEQE